MTNKINLNSIANINYGASAASDINNNNAALVAAVNNSVSRDGASPNQMEAAFDMNSNRIINLPLPISPLEPLRLKDIDLVVGGGSVNISPLPVGGTALQYLKKTSDTDYDVSWATLPDPVIPTQMFTNIVDYGAVGDGTTDCTAAIQAALDASKRIFIPAGSYKVTASLQAQSGSIIIGQGRDQSQIRRDTVYGPTLQIGNSGAGNNAGACTVSNLYFIHVPTFNNGTTYVKGTSTSIINKETSPHIAIYKGQNVVLQGNRISGAGCVAIYGSSVVKMDNNIINGIWDSLHSGLQECNANIGLYNYTDSDASVYFNTEVLISNGFYGGLGHTESRSQTVGNATFSTEVNCGSAYGIYCETSEGLVIRNNYIGGNNQSNVLLTSVNILSSVRIHHNFFDGGRCGAIQIQNTAATFPNFITIDHNVSQGYGIDWAFLVIPNLSLGASACNVSVTNNIGQGYIKAAVSIAAVKGFQHSGNIWRDYNCKGSTDNDRTNSSGLYCTQSYIVNSCNNLYGGATNDPTGGNSCQYGSSFISVDSCTAALERSQNLGLAGGTACNITQTYPT